MVDQTINNETAPTQVEFKIEDIISILIKWKWVILFFSLTIPIITFLMMLTVNPLYKSHAILTVKSHTPESRTLGGRIAGAGEALNPLNEELFIKSTMVLGDVVRELNLNIEFTKKERFIDLVLSVLKSKQSKKDYRNAVNRVNLDGVARRGVWINFYRKNSFLVTSQGGETQLGSGVIGELFNKNDAVFLINDFPHKVHDRFFLRHRNIDSVARELARNIDVKQLGKQRLMAGAMSLEISTQHSSPYTAVDLANTISSVYLKHKLEEASETISQILRFINEQMEELKLRTEASLELVDIFREEEGLYFIEESAKVKLASILQLDIQANTMDLQVVILENLLDLVQDSDEISSKQVMLISATQAPVTTSLAQKINDLQLQRKSMERNLKYPHPDMLANEGKSEEARKMLVEALESQIEVLKEKTNTNRHTIGIYSNELSGLSEGLRSLKRLERVSYINERLLTYLMRRNEETKIQRASVIANVKIIKPAFGAGLIKPQKERYIFSGILAGILVGIGISFLLESMDNSIKSPSWVEKELGLPVYGMIPHFLESSSPKRQPATFRDRSLHLIMAQDPKSMVAEAYRALRTNIQFANMDKKPQIMLITSPAPKEGKSTTIANLAITIANMGNKTLIVDCDLRKPIMHRFFNFPKENGITDILTLGVDWRDVIKSTEVENCFLLSSGKSPPNPSELLGGLNMKKLFKDLRGEFDTIMIDSSPLIPVTDALVLAPEVDAIFLIFEVRRTTNIAAMSSVNALKTVHSPPTGVIINNIRPEDRRYYGYGYGYRYGSKYRYGYGGYGYGYRYYQSYDYYSAYTTEDDDEDKPAEDVPKTPFQIFIDRLLGRKDDTSL